MTQRSRHQHRYVSEHFGKVLSTPRLGWQALFAFFITGWGRCQAGASKVDTTLFPLQKDAPADVFAGLPDLTVPFSASFWVGGAPADRDQIDDLRLTVSQLRPRRNLSAGGTRLPGRCLTNLMIDASLRFDVFNAFKATDFSLGGNAAFLNAIQFDRRPSLACKGSEEPLAAEAKRLRLMVSTASDGLAQAGPASS